MHRKTFSYYRMEISHHTEIFPVIFLSQGRTLPPFFSKVTAPAGIRTRFGNLSPAMGARNPVGIVLTYRPASLCSLATKFQTRFLESIPRP